MIQTDCRVCGPLAQDSTVLYWRHGVPKKSASTVPAAKGDEERDRGTA
jgi:hypothetical protein